ADIDLPRNLDAREADLPVAHRGMHVADREHRAGLADREVDLCAFAVKVIVEVAAVAAGEAVRELLAVRGDADDSAQLLRREAPAKQSFVSKVTVSPGSTSSTGWRPGENDQITWSRVRKCCCDIRWRDGFVLDVNALHVAQAFRSCDRQPDRKHDAGDDPAERD